MKIVFMGTPEFALPSLEKLIESRHEVSAVVTAPDKQRGRGRRFSFTPVKETALKKKLLILQPDNLRDQNFIDQVKKINADLFVIVAFKILPPEIFIIPKNGSFNLHASLLPKFRGAAPIQWSLIKGEKETGVTTFALEDKVDTGNIYLQEKIKIEDEDNFGSLHDKLSFLGAEVVLKTVDLIESGNFELQKQDNQFATSAPKITKETAEINWNNSALDIHNLIRGLSPYPCAYFMFEDKQIKIYNSKVSENKSALSGLKPGEILQQKNELLIGCGKNSLSILELQIEGKKRMQTPDFLRGFSFK